MTLLLFIFLFIDVKNILTMELVPFVPAEIKSKIVHSMFPKSVQYDDEFYKKVYCSSKVVAADLDKVASVINDFASLALVDTSWHKAIHEVDIIKRIIATGAHRATMTMFEFADCLRIWDPKAKKIAKHNKNLITIFENNYSEDYCNFGYTHNFFEPLWLTVDGVSLPAAMIKQHKLQWLKKYYTDYSDVTFDNWVNDQAFLKFNHPFLPPVGGRPSFEKRNKRDIKAEKFFYFLVKKRLYFSGCALELFLLENNLLPRELKQKLIDIIHTQYKVS